MKARQKLLDQIQGVVTHVTKGSTTLMPDWFNHIMDEYDSARVIELFELAKKKEHKE
jgi:hypothetical protein